jgi:TetR/AcrR family transcriptional regulator
MSSVNARRFKPTHSAPRKRRPAATRRRILGAAVAEFSAKGLAGGRVDEIARRAGVSKRMLYHYFGNKDALWLAALEETYDEIRGAEAQLDIAHLSPIEGIRRLVEFSVRYCQDHPEFVSLLIGENLNRARHLRRSKKVRDLHVALLGTIADLLKRGVQARVFRAGIDPAELYIAIAALGFFYFANIHTLSVIFGRDLNLPRTRRRHRDYAVEIVLRFLQP